MPHVWCWLLPPIIPGAIRGEGTPHPQGGAELQGAEDEAMRQQIAQAEDGGHVEPNHLGRGCDVGLGRWDGVEGFGDGGGAKGGPWRTLGPLPAKARSKNLEVCKGIGCSDAQSSPAVAIKGPKLMPVDSHPQPLHRGCLRRYLAQGVSIWPLGGDFIPPRFPTQMNKQAIVSSKSMSN